MTETTRSLEEMSASLQKIADEIHNHCNVIAEELVSAPPQNSARIIAAQNATTQAVQGFFRFLPEFTKIHFEQAETLKTKVGNREIIPPEWLQLNARVGAMRGWMNHWPAIQALISQQVPPNVRPLYPDIDAAEETLKEQLGLADNVFKHLNGILNQATQDAEAEEAGGFSDISLSATEFLSHTHAAYRVQLVRGLAGTSRFLDVGCGSGLKVLTALQFFTHAKGLEFDPGYAANARALLSTFGPGQADVIEADGRTFEGYGDYDVIYFFQPMRHEEKLRELEEQIISTARPGTLLIAPYVKFGPSEAEIGCKRIAGRLFITGANQDEADELRQHAEITGPSVKRKTQPLKSIWEPVLDASDKRGFCL